MRAWNGVQRLFFQNFLLFPGIKNDFYAIFNCVSSSHFLLRFLQDPYSPSRACKPLARTTRWRMAVASRPGSPSTSEKWVRARVMPV